MASTYLTRTFGSSATNLNKMTFSFWMKACNSSLGRMFSTDTADAQQFWIKLGSGKLNVVDYGYSINVDTNRLFRDVSAWYHIVVAFDTTQSTASDRVKIYVNGVQETSFSTATYPSQNATVNWNSNVTNTIGNKLRTTNENFDGSMSHVHFIDGTAYDASAFGEYDANGVWKIILEPSVTYGTNGFFILKDGNSVTDQSGNSNNWTVGSGTLTKTEDNPSNVFATWNVLGQTEDKGNLSNGNLTYDRPGASDNWVTIPSTLATNSGKWYYEYKIIDGGSSTGNGSLTGLLDYHTSNLQHTATSLTNAGEYGWYGASGNLYINGTDVAQISSYTDGDIVMVAVDLDNAKIYWGKNGTWINSGDPTSGSTGTGGFTIANVSSGAFAFAVSHREGGNGTANFGNGYFGSTQISSAGTNASGIGIFEYDVPTGYTALSTKGLNL